MFLYQQAYIGNRRREPGRTNKKKIATNKGISGYNLFVHEKMGKYYIKLKLPEI